MAIAHEADPWRVRSLGGGGARASAASARRQRYREGHEDQLGVLGLVVNAIVLWSTLYMDAALDHLRRAGEEVREEDIVRLWPLAFEHISFLGRYSFLLSDHVARGEMRPLLITGEEAGPWRTFRFH